MAPGICPSCPQDVGGKALSTVREHQSGSSVLKSSPLGKNVHLRMQRGGREGEEKDLD